jgi:outer membrane murein-binding lipoprotein Lpp
MNSIDTEIATLHARIAQLEKEKNTPPPPKITPQKLLERRLNAAKNDNSRPKESPIATACRFSRQSENEMLESIVETLNQINARLDALEKK